MRIVDFDRIEDHRRENPALALRRREDDIVDGGIDREIAFLCREHERLRIFCAIPSAMLRKRRRALDLAPLVPNRKIAHDWIGQFKRAQRFARSEL